MGIKTTRQSFKASYTTTTFDVDGNPIYGDNNGPLYEWQDVKSGVSVPSYREKLRNGQNATSSYSVSAQVREVHEGNAKVTRSQAFHGKPKNVDYLIYGQIAPLNAPSSYSGSDVSRATNSSLVEFLLKARKKQTHFRGLTFCGEFHQALHSLLHPVDALKRRIINDLTHIKMHGLRLHTRAQRLSWIRRTWLESQFHWTPIIGDAKSAAESFSEALNKFRNANEIVRYFSEVEFPYGNVGAPTETYSVGSVYFRLVQQQKVKLSISHVGAVAVSQFNGTAGFDPELWGFSPREFVPTLWELIPWSWAIDYVSNVGKVLDCYSFGLSNFRWDSRTIKNERERRTYLTYNEQANPLLPGFVSGSGDTSFSSHRIFSLNRGSIAQLPSVSWNLEVPGWKKICNLASALTLNKQVIHQLGSS